MDYLDNLYDRLDKLEIFEDMPECEFCPAKCNSARRDRWLLEAEAKRLSCSLPEIVEINGAHFFHEGRCTNLREDGKCRIYDFRPLECRIDPLTFVEKDGHLFWVLNRACKAMKTDDEVRLDGLKDRALTYIEQIEPLFSEEIWNQLYTIGKAINTFDPYVEGKDCLTLREVKM